MSIKTCVCEETFIFILCSMCLCWYRIEPKKACRLEILVSAYFTVVDGKRIYNKGRTVSWVVDSEEYALSDLEKDIGPYFQWGSYQRANFWVIERDVMKYKLDSDAQLLQLVKSTEVLKLMMIVGIREEMEEPAVHKQVRAANVVLKEVPPVVEHAANVRSEERRVGKECLL